MIVYDYQELPRGYGRAWSKADTCGSVCYRVPFNWLARWARDAYYFLASPRRRSYMERLEATLTDQLNRQLQDDQNKMHQTFDAEVMRHAKALVKIAPEIVTGQRHER